MHCKGTIERGQLIDEVYFPWSSKVNPIQAPKKSFGLCGREEVGDLAKVRADASQRPGLRAASLRSQAKAASDDATTGGGKVREAEEQQAPL